MIYTALYRKFRPDTFKGLIGQEHIVRTLANQIKSNRISHAYLFCGTRGTGKTSTAKIFAKAVNCENPTEGEPCGQCDFCKLSQDRTAMVIYEIDAASNNGVDNIRDIIETVKYPPTIGKSKVYIIDEVHMLSTGAFNALLKTLEEPPEHVIFILATTEPHKIPATIHSRCQRFDFRRISAKEIANTLREYMDSENIAIDDDALAYIARVSDGAMRDALSILDQCLSFYYGEHITMDKVLAVVGSVSNDMLIKMVDAVYKNNSVLCMNLIEEISIQGKDIKHFVAELVDHVRNILVVSSVSNESLALNFSVENAEQVREQSRYIDKNTLLNYISVFSDLQTKIKYSSNDRVMLEVACLRLCNPIASISADTSDIDARIRKIEKDIVDIENKPRVVEKIVETVVVEKNGGNKNSEWQQPKIKLEKAIPDDIQNVIKTWNDFLNTLNSKGESNLSSFLREASPCYLNNNCLTIACNDKFSADHLNRHIQKIKENTEQHYKKEFDIKIVQKDEHNKQHKEIYGNEDVFTAFSNNLNW